jgi:hypothetical protein
MPGKSERAAKPRSLIRSIRELKRWLSSKVRLRRGRTAFDAAGQRHVPNPAASGAHKNAE